MEHRALTERIIGLVIEVHRNIRPDLFESIYAECLCLELQQAEISFEREVKTVAAFLPVHDAQIPTYLRMSQIRVGLLMNFHAMRLKDGLRRLIV